MATKSTNSTIITVTVAAIAVFVAWRWLKSPKKAAAATTGQSVGDSEPDYYAPDDQSQQDNPGLLSQLLGALGNMFSGHRSSGASSNKNQSAGSGSSSSSSDNENTPDFAKAWDAVNGYDAYDNESFSQEADDLLNGGAGLGYADVNSLSGDAGQIPYIPMQSLDMNNSGSFITDQSDGSSNAVSQQDFGSTLQQGSISGDDLQPIDTEGDGPGMIDYGGGDGGGGDDGGDD